MAEPEVALVFTPEQWVEELHRHLTDHGGARVRQIVVEPGVALEETYDVLIASYRWPALTHAFVADVQARGRVVLGVFDREEPAARGRLTASVSTPRSSPMPGRTPSSISSSRCSRGGLSRPWSRCAT